MLNKDLWESSLMYISEGYSFIGKTNSELLEKKIAEALDKECN
jgi:hypothetical protein